MPAPATIHTPLRMISQALKDCGRLQTGDEPTGEVTADALGSAFLRGFRLGRRWDANRATPADLEKAAAFLDGLAPVAPEAP